MSCISQVQDKNCCHPINQPTSKVIGIIGRIYYEDFHPKGLIKSVIENSITMKMLSDNEFLDGQEVEFNFDGVEGLSIEKMFYSQFKKRKKLRK